MPNIHFNVLKIVNALILAVLIYFSITMDTEGEIADSLALAVLIILLLYYGLVLLLSIGLSSRTAYFILLGLTVIPFIAFLW